MWTILPACFLDMPISLWLREHSQAVYALGYSIYECYLFYMIQLFLIVRMLCCAMKDNIDMMSKETVTMTL